MPNFYIRKDAKIAAQRNARIPDISEINGLLAELERLHGLIDWVTDENNTSLALQAHRDQVRQDLDAVWNRYSKNPEVEIEQELFNILDRMSVYNTELHNYHQQQLHIAPSSAAQKLQDWLEPDK